MSALLKQKAKVGVATKPRKSFEVLDVFKRMRGPGGSSQNVPQPNRSHEEQKEGERVKKVIKPKIIEEYRKRKEAEKE